MAAMEKFVLSGGTLEIQTQSLRDECSKIFGVDIHNIDDTKYDECFECCAKDKLAYAYVGLEMCNLEVALKSRLAGNVDESLEQLIHTGLYAGKTDAAQRNENEDIVRYEAHRLSQVEPIDALQHEIIRRGGRFVYVDVRTNPNWTVNVEESLITLFLALTQKRLKAVNKVATRKGNNAALAVSALKRILKGDGRIIEVTTHACFKRDICYIRAQDLFVPPAAPLFSNIFDILPDTLSSSRHTVRIHHSNRINMVYYNPGDRNFKSWLQNHRDNGLLKPFRELIQRSNRYLDSLLGVGPPLNGREVTKWKIVFRENPVQLPGFGSNMKASKTMIEDSSRRCQNLCFQPEVMVHDECQYIFIAERKPPSIIKSLWSLYFDERAESIHEVDGTWYVCAKGERLFVNQSFKNKRALCGNGACEVLFLPTGIFIHRVQESKIVQLTSIDDIRMAKKAEEEQKQQQAAR